MTLPDEYQQARVPNPNALSSEQCEYVRRVIRTGHARSYRDIESVSHDTARKHARGECEHDVPGLPVIDVDAELIRRRLGVLGRSGRWLARRVGYSSSAVSAWLREGWVPDRVCLRFRLAFVLGIDVT